MDSPQEAGTPSEGVLLDLKEKQLECRLKELDIQNKEFEAAHRPSQLRTAFASPVVIAAAIASWASITAAGITWLAGQITADRQREAAEQQAMLDRYKFQANLILESVKTGDPDKAAVNLQFLMQSGLLTGSIADGLTTYLKNREPGKGQALPSR